MGGWKGTSGALLAGATPSARRSAPAGHAVGMMRDRLDLGSGHVLEEGDLAVRPLDEVEVRPDRVVREAARDVSLERGVDVEDLHGRRAGKVERGQVEAADLLVA